MKVLFVSGGNSKKFDLSPIIEAQANSIRNHKIEIDHFLINGKGLIGYLKNIKKLRKELKNKSYDLIHAHYSYCGVISRLAAFNMPIIVSFLGSDLNSERFINKLIVKLNFIFNWNAIIVKSEEMKFKIKKLKKLYTIPNGVDLNKFKVLNKNECQSILNWNKNKLHLLFLADPKRKVKNYELVKSSLKNNEIDNNFEIHFLINVKHAEIPIWINASDICLLSSLWEGSPNVIKESMACNKPIISTKVGDVKWLFGDLKGHYLSDFNTETYAQKIKTALQNTLDFNQTNGRERIIELGLDEDTVAKKIISIYKSLI
jgi:teichuronic acid biosynthesis glycosyltransferase TuaC